MLPFISVLGRRIPMYGICMACGILVSCGLILWEGKRRGADTDSLIVIMASAVAGALVGAKALYLISSYGLAEMVNAIRAGDFSFLTDSGLVFYGGLLGGIGGAILSCRAVKQRLEPLCGLVIPAVPLGHAFGRIGCLCAGCCYGIAYSGPLAVRSPYAPGTGLFPVQLLEAATDAALAAILFRYGRKRPAGLGLLYLYLILYAVARFFLEFLRGDIIRGHWGSLSTSQIISVALLCVSAVLWRVSAGRERDKKEGVPS